MKQISVIGAGAWGTALANLLSYNGNKTNIWAIEEDVVESINNSNVNKIYLSDIKLNQNLIATNHLDDVTKSEIIFLVIPTQFTKQTISVLKDKIGKDCIFVICSKGIETNSKKLLTDIVGKIFPKNPIAAISGPNFADEVAQLKPAITTVASNDITIAKKVAKVLENDNFSVYTHNDIIGVELAGALKNVIAIASGIASGLDLSISTKAAILTKGVHEITRISEALGGDRETMLEACGIGDLILTCMSPKSRNMSLGIELGKGKSLNKILSERRTVAEGVASAKAVYEIIQDHNLNCYIFTLIYKILFENLDIKSAKFV